MLGGADELKWSSAAGGPKSNVTEAGKTSDTGLEGVPAAAMECNGILLSK